MAWKKQRVEALTSMWLDGYTASQIAQELGGVSRNAVISKAHRLGLESRSPINPVMFQKIAELPLGSRAKRLLAAQNIISVGDLVQRTEAELLRTPDFGAKTLAQVKNALSVIELRLGMWVPNWPPSNVDEASAHWQIARRASELRQARGGATFNPVDDHFAMATEGDENDLVAALRPMTQQMQSALLQKASAFAEVARRLDNQSGWTGIGRSANTLTELLDRPSAEIPSVLGLLYPAAIELGSFVEFDQQLAAGVDSYAAPLDPEVRRPLSDLVRNLAPWLRAFPSVREADDEASRFLVEAAALKPALEVIGTAGEHALLIEEDLAVFRQLHHAASRGAFQGQKAGGRTKRSASNFVIGVVAFAGSIFSGAVASDVATNSPLAHRVGQFLVHAEKSIEGLIADLPQDLRFAINDFVQDLDQFPLLKPQPPELTTPRRVSRRAVS